MFILRNYIRSNVDILFYVMYVIPLECCNKNVI
jgi:hypothetical protein